MVRLGAVCAAGAAVSTLVLPSPSWPSGPKSFENRFGLSRFAGGVFLAHGDVDVAAQRRERIVPLGTFGLGQGARQGPHVWYVGYVHVGLTFRPLAQGEFAYVSVDTDDHTFAQIKLQGIRLHGRSATRFSTYDLFEGAKEGVIQRKSIELTYYNYLQDGGVRAGRNDVRLHIIQFPKPALKSVRVYRDSAIERTRRLPTPFALRVVPLDPQPRVGQTFRLKVAMAARSKADVIRTASIEAVYDTHRVRLIEKKGRTQLPRLRGEANVVFTFRALRSGSLVIRFLGSSNINSPTAGIRINVRPAAAAWYANPWRWIGLGLLLFGGGLVAAQAAWRRRSKASKRAQLSVNP
jgi:hypothetical protein